jgi:hypothetical protein
MERQKESCPGLWTLTSLFCIQADEGKWCFLTVRASGGAVLIFSSVTVLASALLRPIPYALP